MKAIWTFTALTVFLAALSVRSHGSTAAELWLILSIGALALLAAMVVKRLLREPQSHPVLSGPKLALSAGTVVVVLPMLAVVVGLALLSGVPGMLVALAFLPIFMWSEHHRHGPQLAARR
jgi:hypothetical protein